MYGVYTLQFIQIILFATESISILILSIGSCETVWFSIILIDGLGMEQFYIHVYNIDWFNVVLLSTYL